jgi:hypothetical protein
MGIFLGDRPVSVFFNGAAAGLPVQGAFLGGIQVFPAGTAAATLYFNAAVDNDWATVGNWWLDAEHTIAAGRLPAAIDSVFVSPSIEASGQTVANITMDDGSEGNEIFGTLTVTGTAIVAGAFLMSATITGNAVFSANAAHLGTVTGNATFNDNSVNFGSVTGTATFNDSACNFADGTAGTFVPDPPPACG